MTQTSFLPLNEQPRPKKKRAKKATAKKPYKRVKADYGIIVPVPRDEVGEEYRVGSLRLLKRTDSRYVVWDEESELGEGVLLIQMKKELAVAGFWELANA